MAPRTYQHPFKRLELTLPVRKELPAALPYVVLTCLAAYLDGLGKMLLTDFCNRHFETSTLQSLDSRAHNECCGDRVRSASKSPKTFMICRITASNHLSAIRPRVESTLDGVPPASDDSWTSFFLKKK